MASTRLKWDPVSSLASCTRIITFVKIERRKERAYANLRGAGGTQLYCGSIPELAYVLEAKLRPASPKLLPRGVAQEQSELDETCSRIVKRYIQKHRK